MFGRFFDTSPLTPFTTLVVGELVKSFPPGLVHGESNKVTNQRTRVDGRIRRHVEHLAATTRLNFYQKATLGTGLQAALEAAGYSAEFSKSFSYDVVKLVAVASAQQR